jgi:hypothetical protein
MKKLIIGIMLIVSTLTFSQNSINVGKYENINIPGLKIYSDPTCNTVLLIETTACTNISAKLYDVIGKEVTDFKLLKNGIDMKNLTASVYILEIREGDKVQWLRLVYNPKTKKAKT